MAEFPSVTVDLSEQLEFPGDSYPLTGKVDVATYTVGEKEYQLQDGIDYDVVFTNAGTGVLLTGMVRAHASGECDRCLEPASFDIAGEIEEFYLFEEPEDPEPSRTATSSWVRTASSIWVSPSTTRSSWTRRLWCSASPIAAVCVPLAVAISTSSNAIAPHRQRQNGPLPRKIHLQH